MLVHQVQESEGSVGASVKLTSRTVSRTRVGQPCSSGIQLNLSGVLNLVQNNGGLSAVSGEWLLSGASSAFFVQHTIISGTLETEPTSGFLVLSTSRLYKNTQSANGEKTTEVFFEISTDVSGSPIVATATMIFISFREI